MSFSFLLSFLSPSFLSLLLVLLPSFLCSFLSSRFSLPLRSVRWPPECRRELTALPWLECRRSDVLFRSPPSFLSTNTCTTQPWSNRCFLIETKASLTQTVNVTVYHTNLSRITSIVDRSMKKPYFSPFIFVFLWLIYIDRDGLGFQTQWLHVHIAQTRDSGFLLPISVSTGIKGRLRQCN